MKNILLVIGVLIGTSFGSFAQDDLKTCVEKIKTGKFKSIGSEDGSYITRTQKVQYEFIKSTETTVVASVKWTSDTEYEMKVTKLIHYSGKALKKGDKLKVKVIECSGTNFTCMVWFKNENLGEIEYEILEN